MSRVVVLRLPVEVDEQLRLRLIEERNAHQVRVERLNRLRAAFDRWLMCTSVRSRDAQVKFVHFQKALERLTFECQSTAQTRLLDELELAVFRDIQHSIDLLTEQTLSLEELITFGYNVLKNGKIRAVGPHLTLQQQRRIVKALRKAECRRAHLQHKLNQWYERLQTFLEREPAL